MAEEQAKKSRSAAALRYDPERDEIPVLTAFGEGHMADRIVAAAEEHGIPVTEDKNLVSVLSKLSVGDQIPPRLYEAVAKLLVFVGEMDRGYGESIQRAAVKR